jgi:hypothetical protein
MAVLDMLDTAIFLSLRHGVLDTAISFADYNGMRGSTPAHDVLGRLAHGRR